MKSRQRKNGLSDKQHRVVTEYLANGLQEGAAMRSAGYNESTARDHPERVFKHPAVVAEIERRQEIAASAANLDQSWIIERLMLLADGPKTLAKFKKVTSDGELKWDFTGASEQDLALIKSLATESISIPGERHGFVKKFKIDTTDPLAVLQALARIAGLYQDRLKIESDEGVIEILQSARNRIKPGEEE